MTETPSSPEINLLLASLPAQKQRRLLRRCEVVTLRANEDLYEVGDSIENVYFPKKGCLISLVKVLDDGESFDAGPIGYEGFTGLAALSAVETMFGATVRLGGEALRMTANDFKAELRDNNNWSDILLRYVQFMLVNVSQLSGCNRFHPLEKHLLPHR